MRENPVSKTHMNATTGGATQKLNLPLNTMNSWTKVSIFVGQNKYTKDAQVWYYKTFSFVPTFTYQYAFIKCADVLHCPEESTSRFKNPIPCPGWTVGGSLWILPKIHSHYIYEHLGQSLPELQAPFQSNFEL